MKKYFIVALMLSLMLQSCYTYKANSYGISTQQNEVEKISNPHYIKRKNAIGVSVMGLSIAGAGYAGYKLAPIESHNGTEVQKVDAGNFALGMLIGVGVNLLADKAFGLNKIKLVTTDFDFAKWVLKTNENYTALHDFRAIPISKISDYSVNNLSDVVDYKYAFPNATDQEINNVINSGTKILEQDDLRKLVTIYPNASEIGNTKKKYIQTATSYDELFSRKILFNNVNVDVEFLASELILLEKQFFDFKDKYPNSSYNSKINQRLIAIDNKAFELYSKQNTKDSYRAYINQFINPYNKDEANKRILAFEQEEQRIETIRKQAEQERQEQLRKENEEKQKNIFLVSQYIRHENVNYKMADGDGYTLWEQLSTGADVNIVKRNLLVTGDIINTYDKPLTIKLIVKYNFISKSEAVALVFFKNKSTQKFYKTSEYYLEIPPNSRLPFITLYRANLESQGWGNGMLGGTTLIDVDRNNPITIEKEFVDNIPSNKIIEQNELLKQFNLTGNAKTYDNWSRESLYQKHVDQNKTLNKSCSLPTVQVYFDVESEIENKSSIFLMKKTGIEYKYATQGSNTNDTVYISTTDGNKSVVGEYMFTYYWNLGQSNESKCEGSFVIPDCMANNYTITISNITKKVISVRAN